ncbi:MAG: DUF3034 family protein [Tsuneonella sp.]
MQSALKTVLAVAGLILPQAALADDADLLDGDKLILTNAITTIEGSSGGGISTWSTISGIETEGVGVSAHASIVELPEFGLQTHGFSLGIANRVELSYARQNFDTRFVGAALGLGRGYMLNQDVYGAKVRLVGDLVYGDPLLPQVSAGVQYKRNLDRPVVLAVGAADNDGLDFTVSASKLILAQSLLVSATGRLTEANEAGLLGFGSAVGRGRSLQFEGSVAYQLSRRAVVGAEVRTKPDRLGLGEDDWFDLFAAYALTDNFTLAAAYVDLGSIATFENQRGAFFSAQFAF